MDSMLTTPPLTVVNVSLAESERDFDEHVTFLDRTIRIVRVGADGDVDSATRLVREWSSTAAAIAVTGIREARGHACSGGPLGRNLRWEGSSRPLCLPLFSALDEHFRAVLDVPLVLV